MSIPARVSAATVIERVVEEGAFSQRALAAELGRGSLDARDRGWVTRVVYGTLADLRAVDLALERLLDRGLDSIEPRLRAHLRVATWEVTRSGADGDPAPLVSAAVTAVKRDCHRRRVGLANGVLRNLVRDREILFNPPKKADDAARFGVRYGLPDWIARRLLDRLGDDAVNAMAALNGTTPVGFRIRRAARSEVLDALRTEGLRVEPHPWAPDAGVCTRGNLAATEAHATRRIAIQDPGAQLACAALPPHLPPGQSVLDAAAGLGGKTWSLADRFGGERVVATDISARKLDRLAENPAMADVARVPWDIAEDPAAGAITERRYGAIVLDAPCSALGTMGRHPEVRWNRDEDSVASIAEVQARMIDRLVPLLEPGGVFLYVVCTWTHEETVAQVEGAMARHDRLSLWPPDAESSDDRVDWGSLVDDLGMVQLWPHTRATDGFVFARFRAA